MIYTPVDELHTHSIFNFNQSIATSVQTFAVGCFKLIMKKCTKCGIFSEKFANNKISHDGLQSNCIECQYEYKERYRKSPKGVLTDIYSHQKESSRKRGHIAPLYSKEELKQWLFAKNEFRVLILLWGTNGFKKDKKPSVDRIDSNLPYSLDNIQVMTWQQNRNKYYENIRNGSLYHGVNKQTPVVQLSIDGKIIKEFHSMCEAQRQTNIPQPNIWKSCNNKRKSAGGFIWKYKK